MKKTISIEGMSCVHCVSHVEKALNAIDGVHANVSLENKNAVVDLTKDVSDDTLKNAVKEAGYEVTGIQEMQADKKTIERLVKTARGQLDGILKMVEEDRYCMDISNQLMAADAILRKANKEVLLAHMKGCVKEAFQTGNGDQKIEEFVEMLDKMTK